jgi:hypothetical protein
MLSIVDRGGAGPPCALSAMVSKTILHTATLALLYSALTGCGGGRPGEAAASSSDKGASPLVSQAMTSSDTADLDRIIAENPGAANAAELRKLRSAVQGSRREPTSNVQKERLGWQERDPHDRRRMVEMAKPDRLVMRPRRSLDKLELRPGGKDDPFANAMEYGPMRVDPLY